MMGNYWSIHLPDLLAENGTIAAYSPRGLQLAKYWTEIVAQASNFDEPPTLKCRRRPRRRPCGGLLTLFFDVGYLRCVVVLPLCDDNGRISGWEGTFWDNGDVGEIAS